MAYELYGMLTGNVSSVTGEHVKPAYGGDKEAFLQKVVTPIYNTLARVWYLSNSFIYWHIVLYKYTKLFKSFLILLNTEMNSYFSYKLFLLIIWFIGSR